MTENPVFLPYFAVNLAGEALEGDCKSDVFDFGGSNPPLPTSTRYGVKRFVFPRILCFLRNFRSRCRAPLFTYKIDFPQISPKTKTPFLRSCTSLREFSFTLGGRSSKSSTVLLPYCRGRGRGDLPGAAPTASLHGGDFTTSSLPHDVRHRRDKHRAPSLPKRRGGRSLSACPSF